MSADPPFDESLEPDRLRAFISDLESDGFTRIDERSWEGPTRESLLTDGHTTSPTMTLTIRPSWPYLSPLLVVPDIASWHADQERLCIWRADDNSQRWTTTAGLYERIDEWANDARSGFAGVENARNPEIYWQEPMNGGAVAGLVDIDALIGGDRADGQHGEFHFTPARATDGRQSDHVLELVPGPFKPTTTLIPSIANHRMARGRWFFRDQVPNPPRTVHELRSFLTANQRDRLDKDLRDRAILMYGLVWPNEAGLVATMVITAAASPSASGDRTSALVVLRPTGRDALLLRAGPDASVLQNKKVAVVGAGAIGSHVAEELARAGVGRLWLIDHDLIWPVNLVRHAAPPGTLPGIPKTAALRDHLQQYPWVRVEVPGEQDAKTIWRIEDITDVLQASDLTVDATGHAGIAELIARVAQGLGCPFVTTALFRGGSVARIRRQAAKEDVAIVQRPHLDAYPEIPPLDEEAEYVGTETGCLAQVHNAPPTAVAHAAVLAAEVVVDFLAGREEQPDEIIDVLRSGAAPFDRVGRLRREDLPYTVDITESAQSQLRELAASALPIETGGVLVGCIIDGRPVVVDAIGIEDPNASETHYRVPEGSTHHAVEEAHRLDPRVGYVGEWHSHPNSSPPSALDTAAMLEIASSTDAANPVLVLVCPGKSMASTLAAYVTTQAGLRPADICSSGDLSPLGGEEGAMSDPSSCGATGPREANERNES